MQNQFANLLRKKLRVLPVGLPEIANLKNWLREKIAYFFQKSWKNIVTFANDHGNKLRFLSVVRENINSLSQEKKIKFAHPLWKKKFKLEKTIANLGKR